MYTGGRAPPVPMNVDGDLDDDPFREVRLYTTTIHNALYLQLIHHFIHNMYISTTGDLSI